MTLASAPSAPRPLITPRRAVATVFMSFGGAIGLWGGSVAEVARIAAVTPAVLGSAFVGFGIAGIVGMVLAGQVGNGMSLRSRLLALLALTALCIAALFHVRSGLALIAGLFLYSLLAAMVDLVMNSEGMAVERDLGFPVLAGFHGLASLALAIGSICGSMLSVNFGVTTTAVAAVGVYGCGIAATLLGTPDRGPTRRAAGLPAVSLPDWPLVVLGLIVGASIAGEISAVMFSARTLAAQAPELAAWAGFGTTAYALCQSAVRLSGDRLRRLFGDARIIRMALAVALVGFTTVTASDDFVQTAIGFAIVGVGTALIVPCGFALAINSSALPATTTIGTLALIGGGIRILAPFAYGEIAGSAGYAFAFSIYAVIVAAALVLALAAIGRTHSGRPA